MMETHAKGLPLNPTLYDHHAGIITIKEQLSGKATALDAKRQEEEKWIPMTKFWLWRTGSRR